MSEQIYAGYLQLAGPSQPINTPEIAYDPANYTAYFDNFSVEAVPNSRKPSWLRPPSWTTNSTSVPPVTSGRSAIE